MRHKVIGRKFSREKKVREPFLLSICKGLIDNGEIQTTLARAKEIRSIIEKFITKSKKDSINLRRYLSAHFPPATIKKIISLGSLYKEVKGGYTQILKIHKRKTDGAQMAIIRFVNVNKNQQLNDNLNKQK